MANAIHGGTRRRLTMAKMIFCRDCQLPYSEMGVDLVLPDQQWKKIAPEGGVLCANCICKRAEKFGGTAILAWINNMGGSQ
jgi:hypothetical protein